MLSDMSAYCSFCGAKLPNGQNYLAYIGEKIKDDSYPLALPVNSILAGQYVIKKVLGQGGFGITYRAIDHRTGGWVAVKEFFPDTLAYRSGSTVISYSGERTDDFEYGKNGFLQEAQTLAAFMNNENIVHIHCYFEENDTAYFAMDYVDGISFDKYLKERGGTISFVEAERILIPVMDALDAVHSKGMIHRDVTPDNIYITGSGVVKLLDFGSARYSLGDKSRSLDIILKHGFAPKEQYTRHGKQGPFTDIYSLGATFYYAITGRRPPDSVDRLDEDTLIPPSKLGVQITHYEEKAILQAMSVQPQERFRTMAEFKKVMLSDKALNCADNNNSAPRRRKRWRLFSREDDHQEAAAPAVMASDNWICQYCGTENPRLSVYCKGCGKYK